MTTTSPITTDFTIVSPQVSVSSFRRYGAYRQKFEMASRFAGVIKDVLTVTDRQKRLSKP